MIKPHILVVDDDDRLRALLKKYLSEQGFMVSVASNTEEARALKSWFLFDLMVLDVMMPGESGVEWLSKESIKTPVLMLSALGESAHRIQGLEVGAEDYLSKPFEPKELVLRIKAILRRTNDQKEQKQWVAFGQYRFDSKQRQLKRHEETIMLTNGEAALLSLLVQNEGQVVSRDDLAQLLPTGSNERSVDVQITRLRKKIEDADGKAPYLQTVRGSGYRLYVD